MPKWRWIDRSVLSAILLALLFAMAAPARAQIDLGRALATIEASRELSAMVEAAQSAEAAPRHSEERYRPLFDAALNFSVGASGQARASDLVLLHDMQSEAGRMLRAFLLVGASERERLDIAGSETVARNFAIFADEIGRIYDFRVRIGGLIAHGCILLARQRGNGAKIAIEALAGEQEQVLVATVSLAGDHQLDAAWRRARLDAAYGHAATYARLLGKKRAQEIADRALSSAIAEQDAAVAAALKDFAIAMLR